jgi:hypothetical protein
LLLIFNKSDSITQELIGIQPNQYIDGFNMIFIFSVAFSLSVRY